MLMLCWGGVSSQAASIDSIRMEERNGKWFVVHAVEESETLYSLAKRYDCRAEDIQSYNSNTHILSIGQQLYIPYKGPVEDTLTQKSSLVTQKPEAEVSASQWSSDSLFAKPFRFRFVEEEGVAVAVTSTEGRYALHRDAPVGTFIRLQNQINGHLLLVQVIGRLPEIDANKKTLVQLSSTVYTELSSPDARTRVKIKYLQK